MIPSESLALENHSLASAVHYGPPDHLLRLLLWQQKQLLDDLRCCVQDPLLLVELCCLRFLAFPSDIMFSLFPASPSGSVNSVMGNRFERTWACLQMFVYEA